MNTTSDNVFADVIAKYKDTAAKAAAIGVPIEPKLPYPVAVKKAYKEALLTKRPTRTTHK